MRVDLRRGERLGGLFFVALLAMLIMSGCGCGGERADGPLPEPVEESRQVVEAQVSRLGELIREQARGQVLKEALGELVRREAARPFQARVERGLRYSTVFQRGYVDGELAPVFVDGGRLSERGRAMLEVLAQAGDHGLEGEIFRVQELWEWAEALEGRASGSDDGFWLCPEELEALVGAVAERAEVLGGVGAEEALVAVLRFEEGQEVLGLERVEEFAREEREEFGRWASQVAALELQIADGALRYAREMRHGNLKRVDWRTMRERGGSTEIILERMQGTLRELHGAAGGEEVWAVMEGLEPGHRQYRGLLAAGRRYREIADRGCWRPVRAFQVEPGARSERVKELRERLACEGFVELDGEGDPEVVDQALLEGIRDYQQTHQLKTDQGPTAGFWRSLNISMARRIEQIELNMERWRSGYVGDDSDYILVNIPGFSAQFMQDGEERLSFSVVVGRNNRRCDEGEGRWVYPNATPVMASILEQVVFNPSWWVPARLVEEQIRPRVAQNPDYMAENGFEEVVMSDGRTVIRQRPGPENALGQVKFLFPNEESIYLHDSSQRHFFDHTLRAHSAGCVRVSKPLELARHLLAREGRDDVDVDEVLALERTRVVEMKEELPVIIEYFTVWVDEGGRPNFLADIYHEDSRYWSDGEGDDGCSTRQRALEEPVDGEDELPRDLGEDLGP